MKNLFNDHVQTLETYIMFQITAEVNRLREELTAKGRSPIALSMGAPTDAPPKFVIDKLKEFLDEPSLHSYSTPKGEAFFLEAVAKRMKNRFGVDVDPKTEIFSLIGSKEGIANLIRLLCNPKKEDKEKDIILIPDPGYASYKEMIKVSGGLAYSIPLTAENAYMPKMEDVAQSLEDDGYDFSKVKALIINYPNNPLGATATREYLKSVVDFCLKYEILLISDVAYADMYFDKNDVPASILEFDNAKDIAVEFHSFSKPYAMTGWRLGWICGNKEVVSMFGKLKSTIDTGIFKALQKSAGEVLNSEAGEAYIKKANEGFQRKQKLFVEGFKRLGWDMDNINVPQATFYLWLPIPKRYKSSAEFCESVLHKSGVVLVPGNAFGTYGEGFFRVSIVVSDDKVLEVIDRMEQDGFTF